MTFSIFLVVLGAILLVLALVMVFKPWYVAALPAYVGICCLHWSTLATFPTWVFIFYGAATLMVMGIRYLSPKGEPDGKTTGNLYLGLGALMGCLLGMMLEARFMVLGTIIGTAMGQLAFSRTPGGKWLRFPKSNFIQYLCAKGLGIVVSVAMIGLAVEGVIYFLNLHQLIDN